MVQRAVVAPYEGYMAAAHVRAGESVEQGEVLAELDDRELKLERRKWESEREELTRQYNRALAGLDHAQARILRAQIAQTEAQLALVNEQLVRARLVAPFDGIVISGDLSRSLGTPVKRGQVLFEIAPLNEYRVALQVDERDIADVAVGQRGSLILSALPGDRLPFVVENVSAVSQTEEGRAAFRTEARIEGPPDHQALTNPRLWPMAG
jgi:multidrug resistance efflux pump